jgi:hypothetical protein
LESVTEPELATIRRQHPGVPEHYLKFLRLIGYGSLGGTFMIYSGLVASDEIFDPDTAAALDGLLFFRDNYSGWVVGFDTHRGWRLVGVDNATPDEQRQVSLDPDSNPSRRATPGRAKASPNAWRDGDFQNSPSPGKVFVGTPLRRDPHHAVGEAQP